jgi:hypothetical protein
MKFSGDIVQVDLARNVYGYVVLNEQIAGKSGLPSTFSYNKTLFPQIIWRRK